MKELLKAIEEKKEEGVQAYYEYLMQCDREEKKVDFFQLGVLHGSICGFKECMNMIQQRLKELKNTESQTQSEMEDYIFFLETLIIEMLGLSDIIVADIDSKYSCTDEQIKIKAGDYVKVVNEKLTYDKCAGYSILRGYESLYLWAEKPVCGSIYKVLKVQIVEYIKTHGVALIQDTYTKQVYIIDLRGIEKLNS